MDIEDQFLEEIGREPLGTVRLIYADWLDDQGRGAEAGFQRDVVRHGWEPARSGYLSPFAWGWEQDHTFDWYNTHFRVTDEDSRSAILPYDLLGLIQLEHEPAPSRWRESKTLQQAYQRLYRAWLRWPGRHAPSPLPSPTLKAEGGG